MKEFEFETYSEMTTFLENTDVMDEIIIDSAKKLIINPELVLKMVKIRCKEINKFTEIKISYDNIIDSLSKVLSRKIELEDFDACHVIKILMDNVIKYNIKYDKL